MKLERITFKPDVMGGKPTIRGMRVTVGTVVGLVAVGKSTAEILVAYPYLEEEDIRQALAYAARYSEEDIEDGDDKAWSRLSAEQFLAGYDEADSIYDTYGSCDEV
ncbi:hypothetical protein BH24DEI2_BH24DEI2_28000 [soil metagenome]